MNNLQQILENQLNKEAGKLAWSRWRRHFDELANPKSREQYAPYRKAIERELGDLKKQGFRPWVPIGVINQQGKVLFLKLAGRLVGEFKFTRGEILFSFANNPRRGKESGKAEYKEPQKWVPWSDDVKALLEKVPNSQEFKKAVAQYPEWEVESFFIAELAGLHGPKNQEFKLIQPVNYEQMFLQLSSPFSGSRKPDGDKFVSTKCRGHSDILARTGRGRGSRFWILELKADNKGGETSNLQNIQKALVQAFAYAFCYVKAFDEDAEFRSKVLHALVYRSDRWQDAPPPLGAMAVIPKGVVNGVTYAEAVQNYARELGLFDSELVKSGRIKLGLWEYEKRPDGSFAFDYWKPV
jgi:hypothetical protein